MPDGRKNNRGTVGNKGGRKPKIDEIAKIEMMDSVGAPVEAWQALWSKVQDGDVSAIKTWVEHRFGKAKETKDIEVTGEALLGYVIKGAKGNINK